MSLLTQTVADADGYEYVEATEALATMTLALPCWPGMHWDGYVTTVRTATIAGTEVVIQAWKGSSEKFALVLPDDGGVGGEVGVYRKLPFCPAPQEVADPLRGSPRFEPPQSPCDMWWPHPDARAHISFEIVHPKREQVLFRAGPENTRAQFWLSRLMTFDSYSKLEEKHPDCPLPTLCRMRVHVGSFSFEW